MINYANTEYACLKKGLEKVVSKIILNMDGSTTRLLENLPYVGILINYWLDDYMEIEALIAFSHRT